jgi:hypothetical protein
LNDTGHSRRTLLLVSVIATTAIAATVLVLLRGPPPLPRPRPCTADTECEVRGVDEWERCDNVADPPNSERGPAADATSRTQDGYVCRCVSRQCTWVPGKTCKEALQDLEYFLSSQPHRCTTDEGCDGFFFRVGACPSPVMLPKSVVTPQFKAALAREQLSVRTSCKREFSNLAVCEPPPFRAACREGQCTNLSEPK